MQQSSIRGSANVRRRREKFDRHGDLSPGICTPLGQVNWETQNLSLTETVGHPLAC